MDYPNDVLLKKRSKVIRDALRQCGSGWHSRSEIAQSLGRKRLYDYEVAALEALVIAGRVESRRALIEGPIPVRWEYCIKE